MYRLLSQACKSEGAEYIVNILVKGINHCVRLCTSFIRLGVMGYRIIILDV